MSGIILFLLGFNKNKMEWFMSKTLVAYFSATGNTARVAKKIAEYADADLFDIKPLKPYTAADLDWTDKGSRSTLEMNDKTCRPEIADKVEDIGQYKTIFLGFPVWWYEAPRIIFTFLESYDFAGKVMIPFVTSGSSGLGNIPQILEKACPDAHWQKGIRFPAGVEDMEIKAWVREHTEWKLKH